MNKVDFIMTFTVENANCNGDPLAENSPRVDSNGLGEVSDVCLKRKIRNRFQDNGNAIFVQSKERTDDGCTSLQKRYEEYFNENMTDNEVEKEFNEKWLDVRAFGQVITFGKAYKKGNGNKKEEKGGKNTGNKKDKKRSIGIRGPISIGIAKSLAPITIESMQITKSINGMEPEKSGDRAPDTMGMKYFVEFGTYMVHGAVNSYFAEKTGFNEEDLEEFKKALKTIFINDASSARPDGSMEVKQIFWFEHSCKVGDVSSAKIKSLIKWDKEKEYHCYEDYNITIDEKKLKEYEKLGLKLTIIEGL